MRTKICLIVALIVMTALVCSVGAVPYRDYEMKYVQVTPDVDATGYLYIQVLTFESSYSNTVILQRVNPIGAPAVTNGIVSKNIFDMYTPVGDSKILKLTPTAAYDEALVPGTYSLKLTDGNNEVPEYAVVTIVAGQKTEIHFQGHAVSRWNENKKFPVCDGKITIINAHYGKDTGNCHTTTVIDTPAVPSHSEYRYWIVEQGHWVPEVGHWEGKGWNKHWVVDVRAHWVIDVEAHWSEWSSTYSPGVNPRDVQTRTIPAVPAVTHDATTCDAGVWVDVTSAVQSVVNGGAHSLLFDNRPSPGGIWDAGETTLLSQIADPLPNVIKQVKITYTACGGEENSITVDEYAVINL